MRSVSDTGVSAAAPATCASADGTEDELAGSAGHPKRLATPYCHASALSGAKSAVIPIIPQYSTSAGKGQISLRVSDSPS